MSRFRENDMINVTPTAATKISELLTEEDKVEQRPARVRAGRRLLGLPVRPDDRGGQAARRPRVFESNGVRLFVDPVSVSYLKGAEVDFVDTITGGGFTIKNPNATSTCGCGSSFSVVVRRQAGQRRRLTVDCVGH